VIGSEPADSPQTGTAGDSFRLGPDGIYRCDAFQEFFWQKHGFGTRLASPEAQITLRQIHSDQVVNANSLSGRERDGDALITDCVGKSIGIRTADCVPILLLDCRTRAIAAVHAGWRGTLSRIVERTITKLHDDFDTAPADLYAALGPCIRACCYAVDLDVADRFSPLFPEWEPVTGNKRALDLPEANRRQMQAAGMNPQHIFDCGLCTTCQSASFYSFRREPENPGRMVSAIERLA
jgi:YfiH family protein